MGRIHADATATIANGQTDSGAVYIGAKLPAALRFPAGMTGASVSFKVSPDGVTYQPLYVGNALYSEPVTSSKDVALQGDLFAGTPFIKIVSASAESGAKTLILLTRRVGG